MKTALEHYQCIIDAGYVAVSESPTLICSVCGNGVIVTLWDRVYRTGGMAHCIFPKLRGHEAPTNYHANIAVPALIRQMVEYHPHSRTVEAQLYGGGGLTGHALTRANKVVEAIKKILKRAHIPIVCEDTGGTIGKKIVFDTHTGDVMVLKTRKVRKSDWLPELLLAEASRKS